MKNYSAIILSAGYSSRMGSFKPLMDLVGKSPLQRCIDLFYNCGIYKIIVVTGHFSERIQAEIKSDEVRMVENKMKQQVVSLVMNKYYSTGMYSSIQTGVGALSKNTDAFFLLPADIPSVKEHSIRKLMERYENIPEGILFPTFQEEKGHPTVISYSYAKEILEANPKGGLRDILKKHSEKWYLEPLADRGILLDMDTPQDFQILKEHIQKAPYPDPEECREILRLCNVRPDTAAHMQSVMELAQKITILLLENGLNLNIDAVMSGALLHDVAKGKKHHEEEGARLVEALGYPCLSECIREHSTLKSFRTGGKKEIMIGEKDIIYLCDKLIKETSFVTLEERFKGSLERYRNEPEIFQNVMKRYEDAKVIKNEIENILGYDLEMLKK